MNIKGDVFIMKFGRIYKDLSFNVLRKFVYLYILHDY